LLPFPVMLLIKPQQSGTLWTTTWQCTDVMWQIVATEQE